MSDTVEYILKLKDEMSGTLKSVTAQTEVLNSAIKGVGEALIAYFAFDKIREFASESIKAFEEQEQAIAQVRQGLISMNGASGQTLEGLKEWADNKMNQSLYDDDEILSKVTATMLTFGNITGDTFNQAQQAALDLSTRMGGDLQGAAVQLGKALNDPVTGLTALRRVGVSFTDEQQKQIKVLTESGHLYQAQAMVLQELQKEFGGSAQAAYDALSPMQKVSKQTKEFQEYIGGMLVQIQSKLAPVFSSFISGLQSAVEWMVKNKDLLAAVAVSIGIAAAALAVYNVNVAIAAAQTALFEGAMWLLNIAMDANPVGIIITAVAALAGAFYYAYQKSETFRATISGIGAVLKGLWPLLEGVGKLIMGSLSFNPAMIKDGLSTFAQGIKNAGNITGMFNAGYNESIAESRRKSTTSNAADRQKGTTTGVIKGATTTSDIGKLDTGRVTGSRNTTINITIQKMVDGGINISTVTLKESASQMQDVLAKALLNVVNDAQIMAQQ